MPRVKIQREKLLDKDMFAEIGVSVSLDKNEFGPSAATYSSNNFWYPKTTKTTVSSGGRYDRKWTISSATQRDLPIIKLHFYAVV